VLTLVNIYGTLKKINQFGLSTLPQTRLFLVCGFFLGGNMWELIWPVLLVVGANTFYNICAKSTPIDINAFASLSITYFTAAILCIIMFFTTGSSLKLTTELAKANWTSVILGISILALEFGYVSIYRAGWKIGEASLVANIMLACVLIFVGLLLYKEAVSLRQIAGMIICGFGLYLIGKQ
jgi:hypothetical protein